MAVRFHIDGFDRSLAGDDALVLAHFLRSWQPALADAVRAAATTLPAGTPLRIDDAYAARALLAAMDACGHLIGTPELDQLRIAVERYLAAG
jgi:hypothetical protein